MNAAKSFSGQLIRILLKAYPSWFRRLYGGEMVLMLLADRQDERYNKFWGGILYWIVVLSDILLGAVRMQIRQLKEKTRSSPPSGYNSPAGIVRRAAGALLAVLINRALTALAPGQLPRSDHLGIDAQSLLFAAALSLAVGVLIGLWPALRHSRLEDWNSLLGSQRAQSASALSSLHRLAMEIEAEENGQSCVSDRPTGIRRR